VEHIVRTRLVLSSLSVVVLASSVWAGGADTRVADAAKAHDLRAVSTLIKQQVNVNTPQADGATALHWAAHWDEVPMAAALIAAGAKVDATNDYGVMPMSLAATNGSAAMIEQLLKAGASANAALPSGETVLMTAARTGSVAAVTTLIAHHADVNAKQASKGQTALMWAVSERHLAVVETLLEHGADPGAHSVAGFTPVMFAAREGDIDVVKLLLAKGADINEAAPDGSTPILVATVRGHVQLATFLLDRGAKADGNAELAGYSPLHWASTRSETVITNDYPDAPGEWAALAGIPNRAAKLELIKALLAKGADVNARLTKDLPRYGFGLFKRNYLPGGTPFYLASLVADVEVMRLLLAQGADPMIPARDNTSALIVAAGIAHNDNESRVPESDRRDAVKMLLELGHDINGVNSAGMAAIHGAAFAGADTVVQYLADHGAKLSERAKNGQTPLGITEGNNLSGFFFERRSTAALLRTLGAKSEGAVTLQTFIEKKTGNNNPNTREFDQTAVEKKH
jgi:ankyrin repeat protein